MKERFGCSLASRYKMLGIVSVCVCFPNWTGIVAEVKRGQLKRRRGGHRDEQRGAGRGLRL